MTKYVLAALAVFMVASMATADNEKSSEMCLVMAQEEAEPVSNQCVFRCWDCEKRCDNNKNCRANCYDMNSTCCEANGEEGWSGNCGCH